MAGKGWSSPARRAVPDLARTPAAAQGGRTSLHVRMAARPCTFTAGCVTQPAHSYPARSARGRSVGVPACGPTSYVPAPLVGLRTHVTVFMRCARCALAVTHSMLLLCSPPARRAGPRPARPRTAQRCVAPARRQPTCARSCRPARRACCRRPHGAAPSDPLKSRTATLRVPSACGRDVRYAAALAACLGHVPPRLPNELELMLSPRKSVCWALLLQYWLMRGRALRQGQLPGQAARAAGARACGCGARKGGDCAGGGRRAHPGRGHPAVARWALR